MGFFKKIKYTYKNDRVMFYILLIVALFMSFITYEVFYVFRIIITT